MPVIYIDILFILNLWVDFLLLIGVARLCRRPTKRYRLLLGALAGAIVGCAIFLLDWPAVLTVPIEILSAAVMVLIGFPLDGAWRFIKTVGILFLLGAAFAGVAMAVWWIAEPQGLFIVDGVVYYDISPLMLAGLTAATYLLMCLLDRFLKRRGEDGGQYWLSLSNGGETVLLRCFYDSGHRLYEPFSGKSVVVATAESVLPVCPVEVYDWLSGTGETAVRMIPFETIDGGGMLPAFLPEQAVLYDEKHRTRRVDGIYVAVIRKLQFECCQALIGSDLAQLFT